MIISEKGELRLGRMGREGDDGGGAPAGRALCDERAVRAAGAAVPAPAARRAAARARAARAPRAHAQRGFRKSAQRSTARQRLY